MNEKALVKKPHLLAFQLGRALFCSMLDVVIIGAGPIGMACGIECQRQNLSYRIIDKGVLVNSIYHYPMNMTFFSTSDKLEIGDVPFVSHNAKPTKQEALEYYRRVAMKFNLNLGLYEPLQTIEKKEGGLFIVETEKQTYRAGNVVLATGFYDKPNLLNVPGESLPHVKHYYDDPHPYFNQKVVVVGAKNSAVDVALELWRKGAEKVTMIIREGEIHENVKYWAKPDIENRIEEGSIEALFESEIEEVSPNSVRIKTPNGKIEISADFVLAMTGYQPDFTLLKSLGVELNKDQFSAPTYNPETMMSNVAGLYLAGVICGGFETKKWFIENSRQHAALIAKSISKNKQS